MEAIPIGLFSPRLFVLLGLISHWQLIGRALFCKPPPPWSSMERLSEKGVAPALLQEATPMTTPTILYSTNSQTHKVRAACGRAAACPASSRPGVRVLAVVRRVG
ncbi:hypothetical protein J3E69DRAFT_328205 [Trichoderma sp. SZMC 28015]